MLVALSVPDDNIRSPTYIKHLLDIVHRANRNRLPLTLSYARHDQGVGLYCRYPSALKSIIEEDLPSFYQGCEITRLKEEALNPAAELRQWSLNLRISPDVFPLPDQKQFEDWLAGDFIDPITGILSRVGDRRFSSRIDLMLRSASRWRCREARRIRDTLDRPFLRAYPDISHWIAKKLTSHRLWIRFPFAVLRCLICPWSKVSDREIGQDKVRRHHLFEAELQIIVAAKPEQEKEAMQQLQSLAGAFAPFSLPQRVAWECSEVRPYDSMKKPFKRRSFLLSSEDIARLWHPVTKTVNAPMLTVTESRKLEPSPELALRKRKAGDILIGKSTFRNEGHPAWISREDRLRHSLIIGQTGTGKTTLMKNLFIAEMQAGHGCCLIDPHGDLCDAVLKFVPEERREEIIVFDVADREHPIGFNLLECSDPSRFGLIADGGVSAFKKVFGLSEAETPRLISILRNSLLTLVEIPGTTLLDIALLLTDQAYRNKQIRRVTNPAVRAYWTQRFGQWARSERTKAVEAVLNKLDTFTMNPLLQAIVGQPHSTLDLRKAMDEGKIVLVNLSKGRVGDDGSNMLGSLFVTRLELDAMSRAELPEEKRRPFFVYIDEFQNFATESFATVLSEARKYGLGLVVAHQYLDQIDQQTAKAIFGNIGTLISFRVGADDAEVLARQFCRYQSDVTDKDLINLPRYHAMVRLLADGMPTRRFTLETFPPPQCTSEVTAEAIRSLSRERYATKSTEEIVALIAKKYRSQSVPRTSWV